MRKMRKLVGLCLVLALMLSLIACGNQKTEETETTAPATVETETAEATEANTEADTETEPESITIVYTNDVHSYIDNVVKDDEGNVTGDGLRFSKVAAMVQDLREQGENVVLVDAGDELQGSVYGAMDEGTSIIDLMRATGYQLATPGNHDFDYGVLEFFKLAETAGFPYVSCNFHSLISREIIFTDTYTFDFNGTKVAFVGVTTPSTLTSSTPTYFQDENGEFIYAIEGTKDPKDLYVSVQNAIDSVREDVDYVIGLGHLGVGLDEQKAGISSDSVIANVTGLDAFIDGHSHTTMEGDRVKDKDGKDVVLTQTGNYLSAVGVMTINSDGSIETKLVQDYDREDETVAALEQSWIQTVTDELGEKIGTLDTPLYICNPNDDQQRLIRSQEMNAGDFVADSVYWYFNDKLDINCDVAVVNGGGVRAKVEAGDLSYMSAKTVQPFGNMICLISATGQQILDALEMGVTATGEWDSQWNSPAENGGFLHVAGLSYTIDASVPSSVETDENGMFKGVSGDYRVKDVKVYNKETGEYEPLDLEKEYQLGGINYILRNNGNGLTVFEGDQLTVDYVGQDYLIMAEYIKSFAQDGGCARVNTANSPLASYEGYLLDYEKPEGAGRINIINVNYQK